MADWYRKTTWTDDDAADFRARLGRARATGRAQYLKIQALTLLEQRMPEPAVALLERALADYPNEERTTVPHHLAEALWQLGDQRRSFDAFLAALAAKGRSWQRLETAASFALKFHDYENGIHRQMLLRALEDEAREMYPNGFPASNFRYELAFARLYAGLGDRRQAAAYARHALTSMEMKSSGFARHAKLGLVREQPADVRAWLRATAERYGEGV